MPSLLLFVSGIAAALGLRDGAITSVVAGTVVVAATVKGSILEYGKMPITF